MKKEIIISTSILLLVATPAFAAKDNNNGKNEEKSQGPKVEQANNSNNGNNGKKSEVLGDQASVTLDVTPTNDPTVTPTGTDTQTRVQVVQDEACDPNAQWKNHGQYVSCVAKLHLGGQVTSQAARSDVGKKKAAVTPSVTPTSTPSATPTPSDDLTPTPPITGPETEITFSPLENIMGFFKKIGDFFTNII